MPDTLNGAEYSSEWGVLHPGTDDPCEFCDHPWNRHRHPLIWPQTNMVYCPECPQNHCADIRAHNAL